MSVWPKSRMDRPKFRVFLSLTSHNFCARGFGASGASHDSERTPNVHISGPRRLKNNRQKSTRRHPERQKNNEMGAGEGKKKAKFWDPHPSGLRVPPAGPTLRGPTLRGFEGCLYAFFFIWLFCFFFFVKKKANRLKHQIGPKSAK